MSTVELDFKIVAKQATAQLKELNTSVNNVGKQVTTTRLAFATMLGGAALNGITAAARGMINLAKSSLQAASDAEETKSKFATVFRDIGSSAEEAATRLAESYGLTNTASKTLLSNTGDLLTGFGFAQDSALTLSVSVQELAVDLASFTNFAGGAKGASEALTKALLGETEGLKALGISISQVEIQKQIGINTANGLVFATEKEAKAQATFDLALKQSGNALGDYARTSTGFANQQRQLSALTTNISEQFGAELLPSINRIQSGLIALIKENQALITSFAEGLGSALKATIDGFVTLGRHLSENAAIYKPIAVGLTIVGVAMAAIAIKAALATVSLATLSTAATAAWVAITGPVGLVVLALGAIGAAAFALYENWDTVVNFMTSKALEFAAAMTNFGAAVLEAISPIEPAFRLMGATLIRLWAVTTGTIIQGAFDLADKLGSIFGLELPDSLKNFQSNLLESADAMQNGGGTADRMAKSLRDKAASLNEASLALNAETNAIKANTEETNKNKEAKAVETEETESGGGLSKADIAAKTAAIEREKKFQEDLKAIKDEAKALEEEERLLAQEADLIATDEKFAKLVEDLGTENAIRIQAAENLGAGEIELETLRTQAQLDQSKARLKNAQDETKERQKIQERQANQFKFTENAKRKFDEGTWSDRIGQTREGLNALAGLQRSSNKELAAVGRAAAIVNATVQTYQAATGAYASLAGIPIVGPALGAAAAGAAIVTGLANVAQIKAQRYATGGIVPGQSFSGDTVPAFVNSGEMILNKQQQANLFEQSNGGGNGGDVVSALNVLGDRISNMEIVIQTSDYEIGRAVNRSVEDGLVLQTG